MNQPKYKLKRSTLAIEGSDEEKRCVLIPEGAILELQRGPLNGERIVEVNFGGRILMMFGTDIRERATRVW